MSEPCRACAGATEAWASALVLGSTPADYLRCGRCGLVMAASPTWLEAAYSAPITRLDIGLLDRCLLLADVTSALLRAESLLEGRFLDWAGGYGTLTRLMRDRGFGFVHQDPYTSNVFAEGFATDAVSGRFDLITGFEVLEHLEDPVAALAPLAAATDRLLVTTQCLPDPTPKPEEWWYYTLETGQHITLYTREALGRLADRLGFDGVVTSDFLHLFHRGPLRRRSRWLVEHPRVAFAAGHLTALPDRRRSLLAADLDDVAAG